MRPWATILDTELLAIRARHAAQLAAEHQRIAGVRQRAKDAIIVARRDRLADLRSCELLRVQGSPW